VGSLANEDRVRPEDVRRTECELPFAMLVNECLLVHITHSTADVPVSAISGHLAVLGRASEKGSALDAV
jgi:hypothetical protein